MPKMQQSCDIFFKFLREFGHKISGKSIFKKPVYIIHAHLFLGACETSFYGFKKLAISEHETVKPPQMLMRGRMFN